MRIEVAGAQITDVVVDILAIAMPPDVDDPANDVPVQTL